MKVHTQHAPSIHTRAILGKILSLALALLIVAQPIVVGAQGTCGIYRTFATGDSLGAADLNSIQTTLGQTNMTPGCVDDASANASAMNTTVDPNSGGSASLPTTLTGEIQRLRHVLKHVTGWSQYWTHYEDLNFANRSLRVHFGTTTGYKEFFRAEAHLGSASTRYHLFSLSVQAYNPGEAHPESLMFLLHVNTTVRFQVGIGGDVHVGSTLGVHATGLQHAPALFNLRRPETGLYWPAYDHLAITAGKVEVARFHGAGVVLAPHAGLLFRHASGALHVSAISLAAGSQVQLGDPNVATTVRGAGLSAAANRLLGFNPTNTGIEAKAISGTSDITITHSAGGMSFAVAAGVNSWGSRGQFSFVGSHATSYVFRLQAHAVTLINATTHAATVRISPSAQDVDIRTTGPAGGGRDRAPEFGANTWVHFYWLWDGAAVSGIASAQPPTTGPNLPHSFTSWSYAGAIRHSSAGLVATHVFGSMAYYHSMIRVLNDGIATAETAVDLSATVPPNASEWLGDYALDALGGINALRLRYITGLDFWRRNQAENVPSISFTMPMPYIESRFFYLWDSAGANGVSVSVMGYRLPNGGGG